MIKLHKEIKKKIIFIETKLKVDFKYFIKKIDIGIENSQFNFATNVVGCMTPWDYFSKDEKFLEQIAIPTFNIIEDDEKLVVPWELGDCWGIKQNKSHYTKLHNHIRSAYSCILYLNDNDNNLIIPELDIEVAPKKGKLLILSGMLNHRTRRILKNKDRYAIVFNLHHVGF